MNKRAQLVSQVFVFILAGLIFVLIMTYGYKAITHFINQQEQVILIDFKNQLETAVERTKGDYGSVRNVRLKLSNDYYGVCFLDYDTCELPTLDYNGRQINAPWAKTACEGKTANVFIIPQPENSQPIDIPDINVDGALCIPNTDGIQLRVEGSGKTATLTWQKE